MRLNELLLRHCPVRTLSAVLTGLAFSLLTVPDISAQNSGEKAPAEEPEVFTQIPAIAEAKARDAAESGAKKPNAKPAASAKGPTAKWIWGPQADTKYVLERSFEGTAERALLKATCDNVLTLFVNGKKVASSSSWENPVQVEVQKHLRAEGENVIRAEVANAGGISGFALSLALIDGKGKARHIISDENWTATEHGDKGEAVAVKVVGKMGDSPWNNVFAKTAAAGDGTPRGVFNVLPGFQVELLYTVPKEEQGSWVSLTSDGRGRLLASDQGGKGIYRITPAPIGSTEPTKIEKLDLELTSSQGMLFAFGHLYVSVNGGPGSGLYRAKYDEKTDSFGEVQKLRALQGGGEHGPHALRLAPDGKSIYLIAGNHTNPPFSAGEDRNDENLSSRIPSNWSEDLLLPRMWDANGHARGKLAPGGWIAKTDPEGKTWEIVSIGYRNPYDMAFNQAGELFAYDADMEWDMGSPWYRPTRVVHAVSGSEFGWRSGTGKWPTYSLDSLPPTQNIGPGSPVGAEFGYGTKFPAKYQQALYLCDWTFGTMYALHLTPDGASYAAELEEFISRTPLPLTDVSVNSDGALYFTVGGRGTQSELYRVTYIGDASTEPVKHDTDDQQAAQARRIRQKLETFHDPAQPADAEALDFIWKHLGADDHFIRYAARIALEKQPLDRWQNRVLAEDDPRTLTNAAVALIRQGDPALKPQIADALLRPDFGKLPLLEKLDLLRAWSLLFTRMGEPSEELQQAVLARLDGQFPATAQANGSTAAADQRSRFVDGGALNAELIRVLVYLQSPTIVGKVVPLLETESDHPGDEALASLLSRNDRYGGAIARMLANQPDKQRVHYAFVLRNAKNGWTLETRRKYFEFLRRAHDWSGGNSYQKFLTNIENEAWDNSTATERLAIEAAGLRKPYKAPKLPTPKGPGHPWTAAEIIAAAEEGLAGGRNFKNGEKMFKATRCVICHRFAGDGGATGPDLTQLAGRFNLKDLTDSIVEPSKVISDQYKASTVVTTVGKVYNGRILSENDDQITMLTDPEDSTKIVDIPRKEIDEILPSRTSMMPKDLLKTLNRNEMLDLLAYLLSRGNPQDAMFRK